MTAPVAIIAVRSSVGGPRGGAGGVVPVTGRICVWPAACTLIDGPSHRSGMVAAPGCRAVRRELGPGAARLRARRGAQHGQGQWGEGMLGGAGGGGDERLGPGRRLRLVVAATDEDRRALRRRLG